MFVDPEEERMRTISACAGLSIEKVKGGYAVTDMSLTPLPPVIAKTIASAVKEFNGEKFCHDVFAAEAFLSDIPNTVEREVVKEAMKMFYEDHSLWLYKAAEEEASFYVNIAYQNLYVSEEHRKVFEKPESPGMENEFEQEID